jgi:hypothetical protein
LKSSHSANPNHGKIDFWKIDIEHRVISLETPVAFIERFIYNATGVSFFGV